MTAPLRRLAGIAVLAWLFAVGQTMALEAPAVEKTPQGSRLVRWQGSDPVDVYVSDKPDDPLGRARRLAVADRTGAFEDKTAHPGRPYYILRDDRDRSTVRVAERLLPLERGSNFRDVGGYPAAGGKHVRWGMIYRTAATPLLTDADYAYVRGLGLRWVVDLRSSEERQIAPDQVPARTGARYFAKDYPADTVFSPPAPNAPPGASQIKIIDLYRQWPTSLAPQFKVIFADLLSGQGAVSYHCSAGQDRTGVATALVLTALGVPRDVILADYHLSTADRRPANEMPKIEPGQYPGNVVADFYRKAQASGAPMTARPLYDAAGAAYLQTTFDEIDSRWGSVDNYLDKVLGVDKAKIARLRAIYLE